jgi:hypothetical protein
VQLLIGMFHSNLKCIFNPLVDFMDKRWNIFAVYPFHTKQSNHLWDYLKVNILQSLFVLSKQDFKYHL